MGRIRPLHQHSITPLHQQCPSHAQSKLYTSTQSHPYTNTQSHPYTLTQVNPPTSQSFPLVTLACRATALNAVAGLLGRMRAEEMASMPLLLILVWAYLCEKWCPLILVLSIHTCVVQSYLCEKRRPFILCCPFILVWELASMPLLLILVWVLKEKKRKNRQAAKHSLHQWRKWRCCFNVVLAWGLGIFFLTHV